VDNECPGRRHDAPAGGGQRAVALLVGLGGGEDEVPTAAVQLDQDAVSRVGEVDLAEEPLVGPGAELADRLGQSGLSQRLDGAVLELAGRSDVPGTAPLEELTHESGAWSTATAE